MTAYYIELDFISGDEKSKAVSDEFDMSESTHGFPKVRTDLHYQ